MDRRRFLQIAGVASLSGCIAEQDSSEQRSSDSFGTTQTTSYLTPEITQASLVTRWANAGDLENNAVASIGQGGYVTLAAQYRMPSRQGKVDLTAQATVFDEAGDVQDSQTITDIYLVEPDGYATAEVAFQFDSRDWSKQQYTAEILVREEITEQTSQAEQTAFEIVEPLSGNEAEFVRAERPDTIFTGESFDFESEWRNRAERDSTLVSSISRRRNLGEWKDTGITINLNIPGDDGEQWWEIDNWTIDETGTYEYRVDAINGGWNFTVESD